MKTHFGNEPIMIFEKKQMNMNKSQNNMHFNFAQLEVARFS